KADKKPRGDGVLNRLTPERQAAVIEYAAGHTLAETIAWLKADGIVISDTSLSDWLSRERLQRQLQRNEAVVETLMHDMANAGMNLDQVRQAGQAFFS